MEVIAMKAAAVKIKNNAYPHCIGKSVRAERPVTVSNRSYGDIDRMTGESNP
jgi:hypothetical protein